MWKEEITRKGDLTAEINIVFFPVVKHVKQSQFLWPNLHHWPPLVVYFILTVVLCNNCPTFIQQSIVSILVPRVGNVLLISI